MVSPLRKAFLDTLASPDMQADVQRARLSSDPATGEELQSIVERLFKLPPSIANKLKDVLEVESAERSLGGQTQRFLDKHRSITLKR